MAELSLELAAGNLSHFGNSLDHVRGLLLDENNGNGVPCWKFSRSMHGYRGSELWIRALSVFTPNMNNRARQWRSR
jgi:hypothetical protein